MITADTSTTHPATPGAAPHQPDLASLRRRLAAAEELLRQSVDLIEGALEAHIYDRDNGEEPAEDCGYVAYCRSATALLAQPPTASPTAT